MTPPAGAQRTPRGTRARSRTLRRAVHGVVFVTLVAVTPWAFSRAHAHGASRGLHLHTEPESIAPGSEITVTLDCAKPMKRVRVAFVGEEVAEVVPTAATRRTKVRLTSPNASSAASFNVHAEVETLDGATMRASAIVRRAAGPAPRQ